MSETQAYTIAEIEKYQKNGDSFYLKSLTLGPVRHTKDGYEVDVLDEHGVLGIISGNESVLIRANRKCPA